MTPLHHAAEASAYSHRAVVAVRQLINAARSPHDLNLKIRGGRKVGYTALQLCCTSSDKSFARAYLASFLVARGADIEAKDLKGNTALLHAVGVGVADVVETLIRQGANIFAKNNSGKGVWDKLGNSGTVERVLSQAFRSQRTSYRKSEDKDRGATGRGGRGQRLGVGNSRLVRYIFSDRDRYNTRWRRRR